MNDGSFMPASVDMQRGDADRLSRRARLVERLIARPEPVVVVEAAAGMGKSALLAEIADRLGLAASHQPPLQGEAVALWDIPPHGEPPPLPEPCVSGRQRVIIAKRPGQTLPGLGRAIAYGRAFRLPPEELLMDAAEIAWLAGPDKAATLLAETGGWPLAVTLDGRPVDLADFLAREMLDPLSAEELVDLGLMITGRALPRRLDTLLLPLARPDGAGRLVFAVPALASPVAAAVAAEIEARLATPAGARAVAEAYAAHGEMVAAIEIYQRAGFYDNALRLLGQAGGVFFIYFHGPAALDRILSGFPQSFSLQSEVLTMSLALQALKRGDVSRARRLLVDRFGDAANEPDAVFSPQSVFSRDFRAFRLLMLIYEDYHFSEELLETAFALNAEFASDAHLQRGSFYNTVLEFYIRTRRFAEAEDVAQRAMFHYEAAKAPMLCFYISLHQAMMRLLAGDTIGARKHAASGARYLAAIAFEAPNDHRLQTLLEACIEYESGRAEPLARFLNTEIDDFSHGEIWPSLMEFALLYGSQAMAEHFTTAAARGFLDRWRIYQVSNRQFQSMIDLREVSILQNANRWAEAADQLASLGATIDRDWVLTARDVFPLLRNRDDIGLVLGWIRQIVYESPDLDGLPDLVRAAIGSFNITERQRLGASIWLAHLHKRRRDLTAARATLAKTFEDAARLGAIAPLAEERIFLEPLIDNQRIGGFLATSPPIRQVIRKLRDSGRLSDVSGVRSDLSRRESKILIMLAEGAANKAIASTLGLSEATVKFHLGNVYRKLGCRNRQEAIGSARALGLV
jgi:DNA-binding CsgD family transcriptional regulator